MTTLRIIDIVDGTSVDGPGLRTSIYVAGCAHACPGCHNPSTWPFDAGTDYTIDQLIEHIVDNGFNVTLSGGDPLYQPEAVAEFCRRVKQLGKTVWLYTGFTYEQIIDDPRLKAAIADVDTIVDGPFIQALRDPDLPFRGSSNQRIIHLPHPLTPVD